MSNPNNHGGARTNAGRKSAHHVAQVREAIDAAWSEASRKKSIRALAKLAEKGDVAAFKALMSYAYGTPPSGDEMKVHREVTAQFDEFIELLRTRLPREDLERVIGLLLEGHDERTEQREKAVAHAKESEKRRLIG